MGQTVQARCPCGFAATNVPIGGGMHSFTQLCAFPVLCGACGAFGVANLLDPAPHCPTCNSPAITPYDQPPALHAAGPRTVASWNATQVGRVLVLTDGAYQCPACGAPTLTFAPGDVLWD